METSLETNLWVIRIKSFGWELLGVVITAVLGYLGSENVATLLSEYTGTTIAATLLGLVVIGITKHLRNKKIIAGAKLAARHVGNSEIGQVNGSRPIDLI